MAVINSLNYIFKRFSCGQFLATLVTYITIVIPVGYMSRITYEVADGNEEGLPAHAIGTEIARGFASILAYLAYLIPTFLFDQVVRAIFGTGSAVAFVISLFVSLSILFLYWIGFVRYSTTDNFMAFFQLPTNFMILQKHFFYMLGYYLQMIIGWIILAVLTIFFSATIILICIPIFFIPVPVLITGFVSGKMAQRFKVKVLNADELEDVAMYFGGGMQEA